jgi:transcriptional regulator with XRE-family HTH domain
VPDAYCAKTRRTIAGNVRRRRKELELTQEAAAQLIGMAMRHLQKLEAGEVNVTINTLCKVAQTFDMEVGDLFIELRKVS